MSAEQPASIEADSIQPTGEQGRVFSTLSYVLMWWSSLIVIQAFALGQSFLPPNRGHMLDQ
jgi:cytosine/uracil/thiamine/allantoin permease